MPFSLPGQPAEQKIGRLSSFRLSSVLAEIHASTMRAKVDGPPLTTGVRFIIHANTTNLEGLGIASNHPGGNDDGAKDRGTNYEDVGQFLFHV